MIETDWINCRFMDSDPFFFLFRQSGGIFHYICEQTLEISCILSGDYRLAGFRFKRLPGDPGNFAAAPGNLLISVKL